MKKLSFLKINRNAIVNVHESCYRRCYPLNSTILDHTSYCKLSMLLEYMVIYSIYKNILYMYTSERNIPECSIIHSALISLEYKLYIYVMGYDSSRSGTEHKCLSLGTFVHI